MRYSLASVDFGGFGELAANATPNLAVSGIGGTITVLLNVFFPIAGFVLLAMLISAGYVYMTSGGDPKAIAKAQSNITYSIVGFLVIFAAYFLAQYFGLVLKINQFKDLFGG